MSKPYQKASSLFVLFSVSTPDQNGSKPKIKNQNKTNNQKSHTGGGMGGRGGTSVSVLN